MVQPDALHSQAPGQNGAALLGRYAPRTDKVILRGKEFLPDAGRL
jgi:hypothetical protein